MWEVEFKRVFPSRSGLSQVDAWLRQLVQKTRADFPHGVVYLETNFALQAFMTFRVPNLATYTMLYKPSHCCNDFTITGLHQFYMPEQECARCGTVLTGEVAVPYTSPLSRQDVVPATAERWCQEKLGVLEGLLAAPALAAKLSKLGNSQVLFSSPSAKDEQAIERLLKNLSGELSLCMS